MYANWERAITFIRYNLETRKLCKAASGGRVKWSSSVLITNFWHGRARGRGRGPKSPLAPWMNRIDWSHEWDPLLELLTALRAVGPTIQAGDWIPKPKIRVGVGVWAFDRGLGLAQRCAEVRSGAGGAWVDDGRQQLAQSPANRGWGSRLLRQQLRQQVAALYNRSVQLLPTLI